jgi:hypothetical protein
LTSQQWIRNATEVLESVRHAAEDFQGATTLSRAKTAIRNFLEQARSVTWALEHLKSQLPDDEWEAWWSEVMADLRADPVSQWFYQLRNPIVKEGQPVDIRTVAHMQGPFNLPPPEETRPDGAEGWILDSNFNAFWVMPDGSRQAASPIEGVRRWNTLDGIPDELLTRPLHELMNQHIRNLEKVVAATSARFGAEQ